MTNPILAAVTPLKMYAVERAEHEARLTVKRVETALLAAGNDRQKCAPYPRSSHVDRLTFQRQLGKYKLYCSLTKSRAATRRLDDPDYADIVEAWVVKFIAEAKADAATQYDAFVDKLVAKIGPVTKAEL